MHGHFLHMINCRKREQEPTEEGVSEFRTLLVDVFMPFFIAQCLNEFPSCLMKSFATQTISNNVKHFNKDTLLYHPTGSLVNSAI